MSKENRKRFGAFYTPDQAVQALVHWVARRSTDRMLDPSSGDGRFLSLHKHAVGVEQDPAAAAVARLRAPWALVHEGDFFSWAASTKERFECAAGNPPFIRYQRFNGSIRENALKLCESLGAPFSALTSSWAPFLVATASLLKPGGRMAFVVPAEVGHAPYAQPLLDYLVSNFADVRLVAVRHKIFPELSEDVWLLYADGFGDITDHFQLTAIDWFTYSYAPPAAHQRISAREWREWNCRLRPFLVSQAVRDLYSEVLLRSGTKRLGAIARVGIGYVTGANDFFHLQPSQAERLGIPHALLHPSVRNGRALAGNAVTTATVKEWYRKDDPILLLRLRPEDSLPSPVRRYLDSPRGQEVRKTYKCSNREPWYVVPDVTIPDAFLSYMSGEGPLLVANRAGCVCTNSVHAVRLTSGLSMTKLQDIWSRPFTKLSCEFEGHALGGGMLKVEPGEAQRVALTADDKWSTQETHLIMEGIDTLRTWRHYDGKREAETLRLD